MSAMLRLPVRHALTLMVLAELLAACAGASATTPVPTATPPSIAATAPTAPSTPPLAPVPTPATAPTAAVTPDLTPNDLLLAALGPGDVKAVAPTETWWPYVPEFDVGFSPYKDNSADPSLRFFVAQDYELIGGSSKRQIQSSLSLFNDAASAAQGLARLNQINDGDSTPASGPPVGDASSYFTRSNLGGLGVPTDTPIDYPDTTVLRFRVGPVVERIAVSGAEFEKSAILAAYAAPLVNRIGALVQGNLKADQLPAEIGQRMPPPSDAVGPIVGAVMVPAESWALTDTSGTPEVVARKLHSLGADSLGFGRALLPADPNQVVEATLFPFRDASAASTWVKDFTSGVGKTGLDAGATGTRSAYTSNGGKFYELQFAAGRFVGDLSCWAPYGKTTSACEGPVRRLAAAWYAALSGS